MPNRPFHVKQSKNMARKGRKMYREPSGKRQRPSSTERAETIMSVALDARARQFGVKEAPLDIETNVLGRLRATGELSQRQYEAGISYRAIVADYDRVHLIRGVQKAGDLNGGGGRDGDVVTAEYLERAERAVRRYTECERALAIANVEDRHASYTVKAVVIADWAADYFTPALRVGLNALAHVLQLPPDPTSDRMREAA